MKLEERVDRLRNVVSSRSLIPSSDECATLSRVPSGAWLSGRLLGLSSAHLARRSMKRVRDKPTHRTLGSAARTSHALVSDPYA